MSAGKHRSLDGHSTGEHFIIAGPRPSLFFERGRHAEPPAPLDPFRTVIVTAALNVARLSTAGSQPWGVGDIEPVGAGVRGVIWAPGPSSYPTPGKPQ